MKAKKNLVTIFFFPMSTRFLTSELKWVDLTNVSYKKHKISEDVWWTKIYGAKHFSFGWWKTVKKVEQKKNRGFFFKFHKKTTILLLFTCWLFTSPVTTSLVITHNTDIYFQALTFWQFLWRGMVVRKWRARFTVFTNHSCSRYSLKVQKRFGRHFPPFFFISFRMHHSKTSCTFAVVSSNSKQNKKKSFFRFTVVRYQIVIKSIKVPTPWKVICARQDVYLQIYWNVTVGTQTDF